MSLIQDIIKISLPFLRNHLQVRDAMFTLFLTQPDTQHSAISDSSPLLGPRSLLCLHFCCCVRGFRNLGIVIPVIYAITIAGDYEYDNNYHKLGNYICAEIIALLLMMMAIAGFL